MYKRLHNSDVILRLADGVSFPASLGNTDYVKFLADEAANPNCVAAADVPEAPKRLVLKSVIISRVTDAQLDAVMAILTTRQKERWRAPDKPAVYFDDPETLAVLQYVGADPAVVMAE